MTVTLIDDAEFHTLVAEVLERAVGFAVSGTEQDAARMKAEESLDTLGITAPTTETTWLKAAGIPTGLKDVIETVGT